MKYALGNMLNGAGGLNPDGLALDLQFAADKTLTARKGPTPVLTRGSTGTFVGSNGLIQTAAVNAARFDHDPVSPFACRGLLIEEGRTNLAIRSSEPATWNLSGSSILNDATAPDGGVAKNIALGTNTFISVGQNNGTAATANVVTTVSVFLKKDNNDWMRVQWVSGSNIHVVNAWFNIGNGTLGSVSTGAGTPSNSSSSITPYPNGWYRCTVSALAPTTDPINGSIITASSNSSITRVAGANITVWGAQIEAGSFPTSYIPTTTSALARAADVCSITGAAFSGLYNNAAGTLLSEASIANLVGDNRGIVQIDNNTNANVLRHVYSSASGGFFSFIRSNLDTPTSLSVITGTASTIQKRVIAYEGTSFASSTNGAAVATATRAMPIGLNGMKIGNLAEGPFYLSGHIAAIRYYKKRLPNAKLVSLTT